MNTDLAVLEGIKQIMSLAGAPAVFFSGIGLFMLCLVNKYTHVTDKLRAIPTESVTCEEEKTTRDRQIAILYRRTRILYKSLVCAGISLCGIVFMIFAMFLFAVGNIVAAIPVLVTVCFTGSMGVLLASVVFFIHDCLVSTRAIMVKFPQVAANDLVRGS